MLRLVLIVLIVAFCTAQTPDNTKVLSQFVQVDSNQVTFRINYSTLDFPANTLITSVIPSVTFWKITNSDCNNIQTATNVSPENEEITFILTHNGISVTLINTNTYPPGAPSTSQLVSMTFDETNPNSRVLQNQPETGVFVPSQPLSLFNNGLVTGDWILTVGDSGLNQPICFYEFRLTVNCAASQTFQQVAPNLPAPLTLNNASPSLQPPYSVITIIYNDPLVTIFDRVTNVLVTIPFFKYGSGQTCGLNYPAALASDPLLQEIEASLSGPNTNAASLVTAGSWKGKVTDTPPYTTTFNSLSVVPYPPTWVTATVQTVNNAQGLINNFQGAYPVGTWTLNLDLVPFNNPTVVGELCFTTWRLTIDTCQPASATPSTTPSLSATPTRTPTPSVTSVPSASASGGPIIVTTGTGTPFASPTTTRAATNSAAATLTPTSSPNSSPAAPVIAASSVPTNSVTPPQPSTTPSATSTPIPPLPNGFCASLAAATNGQYFVFNSWIDFYPPNGIQETDEPLATISSTCSAVNGASTSCDTYLSPQTVNGLIFSNVRYYAVNPGSANYACFLVSFTGFFLLPTDTYFITRPPNPSSVTFNINFSTGAWSLVIDNLSPDQVILNIPIGIIQNHGVNLDPSLPQFARKKVVTSRAHPRF